MLLLLFSGHAFHHNLNTVFAVIKVLHEFIELSERKVFKSLAAAGDVVETKQLCGWSMDIQW